MGNLADDGSRGKCKRPEARSRHLWSSRALEGTRTPNLLIRSQMLYPLSYERNGASLRGRPAPPTSAMRQPTGHQLAVHHGRQLPDRCQVTTAIRALITGSNNWLRSVTP